MVRRSERIRNYAERVLVEGNNEPMGIDDIRDGIGRYLNPAYLPNARGVSVILLNSGDFLIEGPRHKKTYRLKPGIYNKKSKPKPAGS